MVNDKENVLSAEGEEKLEQMIQQISELMHKNINEVATLTDGKYFGEQALLNNKPRAATIKCKTDCHIGVMTRPDYTISIGRIHKQ